MPIDNSRYEVRKFPIRCDSMLHGFAGYFDYCTLDVSPNSCSCLSFTLQKMAVQVNVIYFPRVSTDLTINYILFTYDCIFTIFREKTSGDKDIKVS